MLQVSTLSTSAHCCPALCYSEAIPKIFPLPLLSTPACLVWFFGAKFSLENKLLLAQDTLVFLFLLALPALAVLAGHVPVHGGDVAS